MERPKDNTLEEWRPVPGFEFKYWASNLGRVWGPYGLLKPKAEIRRSGGREARRYVRLRFQGKRVHWQLAKAVALAFHGEPVPGRMVCHRDGDSLNNLSDNLYWGTKQDNSNDMVQHGFVWNRWANKYHDRKGYK